jgi:hypothetical protein
LEGNHLALNVFVARLVSNLILVLLMLVYSSSHGRALTLSSRVAESLGAGYAACDKERRQGY